jgi:phospholipase/lecithinase/hemolysin
VTTDTSGQADFTRTVQFMPVGLYLAALARGFSTTATPSALMTPEFFNCRLIGAGDKIFANGFD